MKDLNSLLLRIIISFVVTVVLSILFFSIEQPYKAAVAEKRPFDYNKNTSYFDLNSDGKTERILLARSVEGQTGVIVYDDNFSIIDQYNPRGSYVERSNIFYGDYNMDGISELYLFTHIGDSLFLNIINPYNTSDPILKRKYIEGCSNYHGEPQYLISGPVFEDVNDDGFQEFYFSIAAGFSLQPRALFYYDIENDQLERSTLAGASPRYFLWSDDLDNDGSLEIWGPSNAVGNYKTTVPYTDSSAWLMIYDHNLQYEFEPVEYKGFTSVVEASVLRKGDENKLVVVRIVNTQSPEINNEIGIYSVTGELLESRDLDEFDLRFSIKGHTYREKIYLIDYSGKLLIFDDKLKLIKEHQLDWAGGTKYGPFLMEDTGEEFIAFLNTTGELQVSTLDMKLLATLDLDDMQGYNYLPRFISNREAESGFHLRTYNYDYCISFLRNKSRNYIYLYSLLIFVSFYFFIYFIQFLQLKQEEKRKEIESRMKTLQLQSLKSQMSPHFIFNALNSISAMYIKGDTIRADSFLTSFSKMIREVVDSSDRLIVTLKEELEFVDNYLNLEQVRHEERLSYSINVPDNCKGISIPSMSIHAFVENSIKHGFIGKEKLHIQINVICHSDLVKISIEDNGAGFIEDQEDGRREGKGLKMVGEIFKTFQLISGKKIKYTVTDLSDNKSESNRGSLIEIEAQI